MDGLLGYGNEDTVLDPSDYLELGGKATMLASRGGDSTCALLVDHSLRCWGLNDEGQLGYGHIDPVGNNEVPDAAGPVKF